MADIIEVEKLEYPWERMKGEPHRWFLRFHDFLMLGPNRSIAATMRHNNLKSRGNHQWTATSIKWDWHRRAESYDLFQAQREEDMRFEILHSGLALDHYRVKTLKMIADEETKVVMEALAEVREDRSGLNEALTKRYTALAGSLAKNLEGIAQEVGGRVKRVSVKKELTDYAIELARSQGYDEAVAIEIARMVAIEEPRPR